MREQLQAGLNMAIAGIPWWTTDIGGFLGGDIHNEDFRELLVRWFAWGVFCPVFRLHGERSPFYEREQEYIDGVRQLTSGQDNEVWSFGDDNYEILKEFLFMRERLRPYIRNCMLEAHKKGTLYLPFGFTWKDAKSGKLYDGGQYITVDAPMDVIPVFIKDNKDYIIYPEAN